MTVSLRWEGSPLPRHVAIVEAAHQRYDFLSQALQRIYAPEMAPPLLSGTVVVPLATGGAMAVYKLIVTLAHGQERKLVCKIPHERRITYAASMAQELPLDTTTQLLERLVSLAHRLAIQAPGLFPRNGGMWYWENNAGTSHHLLVEEYIPGLSLERLKYAYEEQFTAGALSAEAYQQHCRHIERLAVATFVRLWDALERQSFTSDPTPWNVLVPCQEKDNTLPPMGTIIDLHSLEEEVDLPYVVQRLAAVYGLRQDVLEDALLPGVLDALGVEEGRTLLLQALPRFEDEAQKIARNLGVDLHQPLLKALYRLQ